MPRMDQPKIANISWNDVELWLRSVPELGTKSDTFLGIARAGIPISIALSYLHPQRRLFFATRREARGDKPPIYDFQQDYADRRDRVIESFEISPSIQHAADLLIVDDVITTGATVSGVASIVHRINPACSVRFASYAADLRRIDQFNKDMRKQITCCIDIDNSKTWVNFPWNLAPIDFGG